MPPRRKAPTPPTNPAPARSLANQENTANPKVIDNVMESKEFGRDKDLKALLKTLQPKYFMGEGFDVPKDLEEWISAVEDYLSDSTQSLKELWAELNWMDQPSCGGN